jgi:dolichol-phosphate mannosyltransferase
VGLLGIFIFLGAIIYTFISKAMGFAPTGWSSMFLAVSFFGSVQLTFLGLIGEYIYLIFKEVQNRPVYIVKDIYE